MNLAGDLILKHDLAAFAQFLREDHQRLAPRNSGRIRQEPLEVLRLEQSAAEPLGWCFARCVRIPIPGQFLYRGFKQSLLVGRGQIRDRAQTNAGVDRDSLALKRIGYRLMRRAENRLDFVQSDQLVLGKVQDLEWGRTSLSRIEPPRYLSGLVSPECRLPMHRGDCSIPDPGDRLEPEPLAGRELHENMPSFAASMRSLSLDSSAVPSNSMGCRPSKATLGVRNHTSGSSTNPRTSSRSFGSIAIDCELFAACSRSRVCTSTVICRPHAVRE